MPTWCDKVDQWRVFKVEEKDVASSMVDRRVPSKDLERMDSTAALFCHTKVKAVLVPIGRHGEEGLEQAMISSRFSLGSKVLEEVRHNLMVLVDSYHPLHQTPATFISLEDSRLVIVMCSKASLEGRRITMALVVLDHQMRWVLATSFRGTDRSWAITDAVVESFGTSDEVPTVVMAEVWQREGL